MGRGLVEWIRFAIFKNPEAPREARVLGNQQLGCRGSTEHLRPPRARFVWIQPPDDMEGAVVGALARDSHPGVLRFRIEACPFSMAEGDQRGGSSFLLCSS